MAGRGGCRRRAVRGAAAAGALITSLLLSGCAGVAGTAVAAPTRTTSAPAVDRSDPVRIFDERRVAAGVTQVLTEDPPDGYGLTGVRDVTCPRNQRVEVGATFDCAFELDGQPTTVTIIVRSQEGLYEVQPPNRPT